MTVQITIIGLSQLGASIGLALGEHKDAVRRLGHDREPTVAKQADKLGAVDQVSFNLPSAVRQADVIVLAEPVDRALETLRQIAPDLKPGTVVLDTTPTRVGMLKLAGELFQEDRHYIALSPTLNPAYLIESGHGVENAHADLFHNSMIMISSPPSANPEAIKLASDFSVLLGATPFFGDPYELDGLIATTSLLPQIAAAGLINATTGKPGWREARKMAGKHFAEATAPAASFSDDEELGQALLLNRENSLRVLDDYIQELEAMRAALAASDADALKDHLENAREARAAWLGQRTEAKWEHGELPATEYPGAKEFFSRLVGLRSRSKLEDKRK
jgi:prephenate dehydrogenase